MRDYILTGKKGEELAVNYLLGIGFEILHRNWRYRRAEIDIVASCGNVLHFVEVKTRTTAAFGQPEESVTRKKINTLLNAGAAYCYKFPGWKLVQHDVLAILITGEAPPDFLYIQDISL